MSGGASTGTAGFWRMSRGRRWLVAVAAVLVVSCLVVVVVAAFVPGRDEAQPSALALPSELVGPDPLSFERARMSAYERAAAFGLSHALFAKSPGGVVASARRTAGFRTLIEDAAEKSGFDADLLEAIVFLESAGRPDVIAGNDVEHAAGLTQIVAETATNFLGMEVDVAASRRLTRQIEAARTRGNSESMARLRAR